MVTCDLTDLLPYLEVGNQDQIAALQIMLPWVYPNDRSHCSDPKVIETEAPRNDMITVDCENSRHTTQSKTKSKA